MYDKAVACPHCGARQDLLDPLMEGLDAEPQEAPAAPPAKPRSPTGLSREEAGALATLATASVDPPSIEGTQAGAYAWLFLPQTAGRRRGWEIGLTVLALPLITLTILVTGWWAFRFRLASSAGLTRLGVPVAAVAMFCFAMAAGTGAWAAGLAVGGMLLAWLVREILRMRRRDPFV
jgi:hypothetical protein